MALTHQHQIGVQVNIEHLAPLFSGQGIDTATPWKNAGVEDVVPIDEPKADVALRAWILIADPIAALYEYPREVRSAKAKRLV